MGHGGGKAGRGRDEKGEAARLRGMGAECHTSEKDMRQQGQLSLAVILR